LRITLSKPTNGYKIQGTFGGDNKSRPTSRKALQWIISTLIKRDDGLYDADIAIDKILITMSAVNWLSS
jgi:hypothetical protein